MTPEQEAFYRELHNLLVFWRILRSRQQSSRKIEIADTYEDREEFVRQMDALASHGQKLGI